ncbi:hypothetical protein O1D97_05645 [Marinomonas sp. 15G1-11]|uniref:Uncharacterized protein n=1 Tax=Marinomonas phaeophyticola TaxID=3004091 RepID=A0ABT4JRZ0_9GAMM|nr:hypothetical protein [Marinomonas sp. 15G1-11]MCZ2721146.1 hypothetical protein [Marinomonas sp. 15G1-11]
MNIREIVETQITHSTQKGKAVSGNPQFALLMSLFAQPGPALQSAPDTLSQQEVHAVNRPIRFSHHISSNPSANIALLKALGEEPLALGLGEKYDPIKSIESLLPPTQA